MTTVGAKLDTDKAKVRWWWCVWTAWAIHCFIAICGFVGAHSQECTCTVNAILAEMLWHCFPEVARYRHYTSDMVSYSDLFCGVLIFAIIVIYS